MLGGIYAISQGPVDNETKAFNESQLGMAVSVIVYSNCNVLDLCLGWVLSNESMNCFLT